MISLLWELHPTRILYDASAGVVVLALHGLFLALAAKWLGDRGPSYDGRLTADPSVHIDIYALVGVVVTGFGWVKPMDIRPNDIKGRLFGIAAAALFAIAATFALGRLAMANRGTLIAITPPDLLQFAEAWLFSFTRLSDRIAGFNLLPLFALTAAHIVQPYLPARLRLPTTSLSALTLALAFAIKLWVWR
ncbi:hypothetical protein [Devosia sp. MC1541]|uniref:hypothetical protein n=1 Tax=Devosia sp. MC1541 TaxID=2725264 RepID=UPI00145F93CE|nr:hypothetical protein [Devosia sp. MC1541]